MKKRVPFPPSTYPDFATFPSSFATGDVLLNLDWTCYYKIQKVSAPSLLLKERRLVPYHVIPLRLRPFLWNWMVPTWSWSQVSSMLRNLSNFTIWHHSLLYFYAERPRKSISLSRRVESEALSSPLGTKELHTTPLSLFSSKSFLLWIESAVPAES